MSDTADDLIMQQTGTSDLDRAKRIINKQQEEIKLLKDIVFHQSYNLQLHVEYKTHHEFVLTQINDILGTDIKVLGDLIDYIHEKNDEIEKLKSEREKICQILGILD